MSGHQAAGVRLALQIIALCLTSPALQDRLYQDHLMQGLTQHSAHLADGRGDIRALA